MGNEAHVGLVDAHAERNRRHDNDVFLAQEAFLVLLTNSRLQSCVVGQRDPAVIAQERGNLVDLATRHTIDDA